MLLNLKPIFLELDKFIYQHAFQTYLYVHNHDINTTCNIILYGIIKTTRNKWRELFICQELFPFIKASTLLIKDKNLSVILYF